MLFQQYAWDSIQDKPFAYLVCLYHLNHNPQKNATINTNKPNTIAAA